MKTKRKHHRNRRHHRRHLRLGNTGRRHHRRHHNRRRSRGFRLFNPGPDIVGAGESLAAAMLAGAAGYIASKGIGIAAEMYLPDSLPQKGLMGTTLSAVVAAVAAQKLLKNKPKVSAAVVVGATIPVAEQLIGMTPLGAMIGILPEAGGEGAGQETLPAPGGVSAALAARLGASLRANDDGGDDDDDDDLSGYRGYWA